MELNLTGKNALVCGASRGIGRATAHELAALGCNVTALARSGDVLSALIAELPKSAGQQHSFLIADYTDQADLKQKVLDLAQSKPIHILINNTGGPAGGPITESDPQAFLAAFNQHLINNQILAQCLLPGMKKAGFGRIINVISTSVKQPITGLGVSNTIRGAVANWAKTLANEVAGFGITVNNLLPGSTNTERLQEIFNDRATRNKTTPAEEAEKMKKTVPAGRFAEPNEIGAAIAFLASPAASYINGINLPVDGGRTKSL